MLNIYINGVKANSLDVYTLLKDIRNNKNRITRQQQTKTGFYICTL